MALARAAVLLSSASRRSTSWHALRSPPQPCRVPAAAVALLKNDHGAGGGHGGRPNVLLTRKEAKRFFRATRRAENPILIGIVIVVGATLARYLIRAARRVSKEEATAAGGSATAGEAKGAEEGEEAHHAHASSRGFPVLGVDLGSLQSCVTYVASKTATPLVVENHEGRRSTPAFLAYEEGHLVVGQLARRARWREPGGVAFNVPRLLGTTAYEDALRPLFPFPVEPAAPAGESAAGAPPVALHLKGGRPMSPVEASARLLEDLVQTAEHKLHHLPNFAVVTVPSYFDQRGKGWALQAAQDGTGLGGADGVEVVEDSIAALVCAHYTGAISKEAAFLGKPWLVVDVGGLNAQLSVVGLDPEHGLAVKHNRTTWGVGGEQLDYALVRHLVEEFKLKHGGLDLGQDYLALERLHEAAEAAKQELGSKVSSNIRLPFISADNKGPKHLDATVSRAQFENLVGPLLAQLEAPFREVLEGAGLGLGDLEGILLCGGCMRLPFMAAFVGKKLTQGKAKVVSLEVPPEEMVALGAGYFGRELVDDDDDDE